MSHRSFSGHDNPCFRTFREGTRPTHTQLSTEDIFFTTNNNNRRRLRQSQLTMRFLFLLPLLCSSEGTPVEAPPPVDPPPFRLDVYRRLQQQSFFVDKFVNTTTSTQAAPEAPLFSEADIHGWLSDPNLEVEVLNLKNADAASFEKLLPQQRLNFVKAKFARGHSVIVNSISRAHPNVLRLTQTLANLLQFPVDAYLYWTPKNSSSYPAHADEMDALAYQVSGKKIWHMSPMRQFAMGPPSPVERRMKKRLRMMGASGTGYGNGLPPMSDAELRQWGDFLQRELLAKGCLNIFLYGCFC